jgi:glucose/arabinose dehydrogenase
LDGSGQTRFAFGLRNSVGLAWNPVSGELWGTDNGGDGLGDDVPPDEVNIIRQNGDYGWPDCMGDRQAVNWGSDAQPNRCPNTIPPAQPLQAHSAPLGISFYTGNQFPSSYLNNAFVAFHGSWNRNEPTGYKVVRIHDGVVEDFLTGFLDLASRTTSGRPCQPVPGSDGALYISDDFTGNIYRVAYTGPRINPEGIVDRGSRTYELYGSNLAGSTVMVNDVAAQILYSSPGQINFVAPGNVAGALTVTVRKGNTADSMPLND